MTDKQIIIEDCPYFIGGNCQEYLDGVCENHKCDLKIIRELEEKLKRKEQECEFNNLRIIQLQETLSQYETDLSTKDCIVETCKAQYKELEAENERLKKEIRLYDCIDKWGTEQCRCACRCLSNEFCDAAEEKMKNIKQTLAEINRMAENTYCLTNTTNKDMAQFAKQILQKISECEGNDGK